MNRTIGLILAAVMLASAAAAQPANRKSKIVARYGYWNVIAKSGHYITETGASGRYRVCSAVLFSKTASLEFETKNAVGWGVYVGREGWSFSGSRARMTLASGRQKLVLKSAVYAGSMVSAASHDLLVGSKIPLAKLRTLVAQEAPISVIDAQGRTLAAFPNDGPDLTKALDHALRCTEG